MRTYCLLHFEHINDVTIHYQTSQSFLPAARSSLQKFDNDCDATVMFKM